MNDICWMAGQIADPRREAVICAAIVNARDQKWCDFGTDFTVYVPDGQPDAEHFRMWLLLVNRHLIRLTGVGVFDHEDYGWRDTFDAGTSPRAVVQDWLADTGIGDQLSVGDR